MSLERGAPHHLTIEASGLPQMTGIRPPAWHKALLLPSRLDRLHDVKIHVGFAA